MSTKDDASIGHSSNGQSLVVQQAAPLNAKDADWGPVSAYARGHGHAPADPSAYFHAVRRHWFVGLLLGVILASACGVGVWFLLPKHYTAKSLIQIKMAEPSILDERKPYFQQEYTVYKATQAQLIKSRLVLMAALRKPGIASLAICEREKNDPITWLQDELNVFFPGDSEIMEVSLTDNQRTEVAQVVRAVVDAYLSEIVDTDKNANARELANLEELSASKDREIRNLRTTLKQLADEVGTADREMLHMQLQFETSQLTNLKALAAKAQMELHMLQGELTVKRQALARLDKSPVNTLELEKMKLNDPLCREIQKKLSDLQMVAAQAVGKAKPGANDSFSRQIVEQINSLQAELNAQLTHLSEILTDAMRNEIKEEIEDLSVRVEVAAETDKRLQDDVVAQTERFSKLGQSSVDLEMMRADLENREIVAKDIAMQKQAREVEARSRPRIEVVQHAEDPPTYGNLPVNAGLSVIASLAGLILPLASLVWWDVRKQRINSPEDVVKGLGLPVMGSVPMIPGRAIRHLNAPGKKNQQWNVRLAESIDGIAARLLRNAAIDHDRVVLITSAVSGEGKTTLATQIAMSLARAGRPTVLVDFDLRRPAIDKAFQLPLHPGVSEALCGENDVATLPQDTGLANLQVITAGRCDRHALQALAKGGDKLLFDALRQRYDFVIVDGSPILPVADSRYVSQHVDSVVLSIFRDFSRAPKVAAACEILESFGVADIEAIVTSSGEDGYGLIDTVVTQRAPATA